MPLLDFLNNKPLYYTEIDYTRMPRVYEKIKSNFSSSKIIHIIGTNGKGTTGRFLASALYNSGHKTGHYTSPHILKFNERIWLDGENASDEALESSHEKLQKILSKEDSNSLSYFEYTTFLAMLVFNECEYIVLEAGLGGQHDATAVFEKTLTLVTPIDYDHQAFLGSSIKDIVNEKLNAIQKNAILANQKYEEVNTKKRELESKKNCKIFNVDELLNEEDKNKIDLISQELSLVSYLQDNLKLSISALKFLDIDYKKEDFKNSKLFGRLSKINENIIIDVGHNPLAAQSIVNALGANKYILIYNTYEDKDYKKILEILKPIIKHVEIIDIKDKRIEKKETLQKVLTHLKIECHTYKTIQKDEKYLVFGSFSVVEEFLKVYNE